MQLGVEAGVLYATICHARDLLTWLFALALNGIAATVVVDENVTARMRDGVSSLAIFTAPRETAGIRSS